MLSYQSGYPYGNGRTVWERIRGVPTQVQNDNYALPGYNYYFLENPSLPFNARTNPYIATLGRQRGRRSQHAAYDAADAGVVTFNSNDLSPHVTVLFDVSNLLGVATPTQLQRNPDRSGRRDIWGKSLLRTGVWSAVLQEVSLYAGNGIPTNDGRYPAVPWAMGNGGIRPRSVSHGAHGPHPLTIPLMKIATCTWGLFFAMLASVPALAAAQVVSVLCTWLL